MREQGARRRGKKGVHVPLEELGFKAKVYAGIETEYTRRRVKYKAARYGVENSRECFMGRCTFTLDADALTHDDLVALSSFSATRKHEWERVRAITYHSREELVCPVCLEKKFAAPVMTHCGHVFCWHCLYMHHYKSLKANNCPVCNELYSLDALVSCRPLYGRAFPELERNRIRLALKCHLEGDRRVFSSDSLKEDLRFARVIKATHEQVASLYRAERDELATFVAGCDEEETREWAAKVLALAYDKVEQAEQRLPKREYRLLRGEAREGGYVVGSIEDRAAAVTFYQQHSGRLIFLHPLCDKFLRSACKELPVEIEEEIVQWEEVEYNMQLVRRYRQLHHVVINQEIDLVIIDLRRFLSEQQHRQFEAELEQCRARKQEDNEREEREAERLHLRYEQEKEYLNKLKKMEESEFYDIRVPTTINPRELGDNAYFPSLIQTKSQPDPSTLPLDTPQVYPEKEKGKQKGKEKEKKVIDEGDFPGLNLAPKPQPQLSEEPPKLFVSKSEQPKVVVEMQFPELDGLSPGKKGEEGSKFQKKGRKKKEKFVNVTDQFFQKRQEDD